MKLQIVYQLYVSIIKKKLCFHTPQQCWEDPNNASQCPSGWSSTLSTANQVTGGANMVVCIDDGGGNASAKESEELVDLAAAVTQQQITAILGAT